MLRSSFESVKQGRNKDLCESVSVCIKADRPLANGVLNFDVVSYNIAGGSLVIVDNDRNNSCYTHTIRFLWL